MLGRFIDYIREQHLFPSGQEVLLAVSGGRDSVCMAHLFHRAGIPFAIAHCNFHLRPGDCDRDEAFVRRLADTYGVPCHVASFDTRAVASAMGESIEEAARRLRYEYFSSLITHHSSLTCVATAHHRDDSIETFFLNLFRGTGIAGLHGIRPRSSLIIHHSSLTVVRPLLCFSRTEINRYVEEHCLEYVEDYTNGELDARRNQLRLRLMPLMRELYPSIDDTMAANIERLHDTEIIYKEYLEELRSRLLKPYSTSLPFPVFSLDINALRDPRDPKNLRNSRGTSATSSILFEFLRSYGFNAAQVSDILAATENGKLFFSPTHVAELHRGQLLVAPQVEPAPGRHPQPGDRIKLKKGSRLLSDYLKDLGLSRIERRHLLLDSSHGDEPVGTVAGLAVVDKDGVVVGHLPVVTL